MEELKRHLQVFLETKKNRRSKANTRGNTVLSTGIVKQKIGNELTGVLLIGLAILLFSGSYFEERGIIYAGAIHVKWFVGGAVWYLLFLLGYSGYLKFRGKAIYRNTSGLFAWIGMLPVLCGLLQSTEVFTGITQPGGRLGWVLFHILGTLTSEISTVIILVTILLLLLMAALSLPLTQILKTPLLLTKAVGNILFSIVYHPLCWLHNSVLFILRRLHRIVMWIIEDLSTIGDYIAQTLFKGSGRDTLNTRFTRHSGDTLQKKDCDIPGTRNDDNVPFHIPKQAAAEDNGQNKALIVAHATVATKAARVPNGTQASSSPEKGPVVANDVSSDGVHQAADDSSGCNASHENVPIVRGDGHSAGNRTPLRMQKADLLPPEDEGPADNTAEQLKGDTVDDKTSFTNPVSSEEQNLFRQADTVDCNDDSADSNNDSADSNNDSADGNDAPASPSEKLKIRAERAGKNAQLKLFTGVSNADDEIPGDREWLLPSDSLFEPVPEGRSGEDEEILRSRGEKLIATLAEFKIEAKIIRIVAGPTITQFQIKPASGIRLSKITNLSNDIAMALACKSVRIEAPIPGKSAVGIEIPNEDPESVLFSEMLASPRFKNTIGKNRLAFALGKSIEGKSIIANLAKMPHLLVAGATGAGKSVCINTILASILCRTSPEEVRMLMIDPKMVELVSYNKIPHLISDVITNPQDAGTALSWAVMEMERRYQYLSTIGCRNIDSYNSQLEAGELYDDNGDPIEGALSMPHMVIVVDELADLMMVAAKEIEHCICRLAQMARAVGMHLIIATQRPSTNVITGVIKANFPSRIAFAVSSKVDSKVILDTMGADALLGKGDMLYHPVGQPKPMRVQGAFISEEEVKRLCSFLREQGDPDYINMNVELVEASAPAEPGEKALADEMWEPALRIAVELGEVSTSLIQRHLTIGYNRAARIIDAMFERGIISGQESGRRRKVLIGEAQIGDYLG